MNLRGQAKPFFKLPRTTSEADSFLRMHFFTHSRSRWRLRPCQTLRLEFLSITKTLGKTTLTHAGWWRRVWVCVCVLIVIHKKLTSSVAFCANHCMRGGARVVFILTAICCCFPAND